MNNAFNNKLRQIQTQLPLVVRRIPSVAKREGLQFIADNFEHRGFEKKTGAYKKWKSRKRSTLKGYTSGRNKGKQHGMLQKSGKMKRSFDEGSTSNDTQAVFTSQLPYTEVHNDGLHAGRPPGFTMPQRQMIGESDALNARIEKKVDKMVSDIFK